MLQVTTAEILTTEIRTTGHSAANAMGRTGAFVSPYLVGKSNLKVVGSLMLIIHLFTAWSAYHLPESKGRDLGHTSLEDDDAGPEEEDSGGNEMTFRYDNDTQVQPTGSATGIV